MTLKHLISPEAKRLITRASHFLIERHIQGYLVGGFVRDWLLGRETHDIDIAIKADALEIAPQFAQSLGGRYVLLDEANKIVRVVAPDTEHKTQWQLDISSFEGRIEDDLARRDFTVNALAIPMEQLQTEHTGEVRLIDPLDGASDLQRRIIRATSDSVFVSDAARLLRAVRLAAELDFNIAEDTQRLIQRDCHLASAVAGERVREDLLRLLAIPGVAGPLSLLDELELLTVIMPELKLTKGVKQPKEHYWEVFEHLIKTVAALEFLLHEDNWDFVSPAPSAPWSPELADYFALEVSSGSTRGSLTKLAALLHDIAKPQTKAPDATGRIRFLGHQSEGAEMAVNILERLRFSGKEIKLVEAMVRHHLRPTQMSHDGLPTRRAIYRFFRDTGEAAIEILFLSLADHLAARGPGLILPEWQEHVQVVEYMLQKRAEEKVTPPPKLLDGNDLMEIFGMDPGPRIGELLELVREAQAAGEIASREEAINFAREHMNS
ncbi:MAG: CCA tRNA nucleotidyltransferase [Chloroflexi bacterium]|nr:CCA tRNA nucleotidyltransferase [Chloroflexota bacterium]